MPNWKKLITSGSDASLTSLTLTSLPSQGSEATSVMINSGGVLGTRELGSLAFSSATYDNYSSWNLKTNSVQRTTVGSGGTLDIIPGTNIGVSYAAGGKVTISNSITNNNQLTNGAGYITSYTDTNYYLDGISKSGNTLTFSVNGATDQTYTFGANAFNSTTIPENVSELTNDSGYITSYTDTNYYLDGITKSGNTLTFSVNGTTNQTYTFGANAFNSTTIPTNNNQLTNGAGYITGHPSITAASSVNNSGRTYIQDITLDSNGHVTGIASATETVTDTNYYLDGITKSSNTLTFSVNGATNQTYTFGSNAFTSYTNHATQGYLTSYTETDTLASVTSRGATTSTAVTFGDVTVSGDLTVNGTTTTINTTNLEVEDKLIAINHGGTTAASADGAGLFISGANESLTWDNDNSTFSLSAPLEVIGSGSTILDIQGSVGQLFSVTDELTGDLFTVSDISGIPILSVNSSGTVNIDGTLSGSIDSTFNSIGVGTDASGTAGEIRATNDITAYYSSDERLKDNIINIQSPLDKLKQINGVTFDWIEKPGIHSHTGSDVGVIAQEIEKVLPDIVTTRDNGYKAVQYEKIVALLIESNKALLERVEYLESKIK